MAAWSLHPHWQIAANLADTELELGKHREAVEHAAYYQKNAPANRKEKADALLKRARAQVGAVTVQVDAAGAEILVDDAPAGRAPLRTRSSSSPAPIGCSLALPARPDATQTVTLAAGGAQSVTLSIPAGETRQGPPEAPPSQSVQPGANKAIVIAGAATSGVGLAIGIGLAVASASKGSAADSVLAGLQPSASGTACTTQMSVCTTIDSDRRAHDALGKGAIGAFAAGAAIGLATVGYVLFAPRGPSKVGARIVPCWLRIARAWPPWGCGDADSLDQERP